MRAYHHFSLSLTVYWVNEHPSTHLEGRGQGYESVLSSTFDRGSKNKTQFSRLACQVPLAAEPLLGLLCLEETLIEKKA